MLSVLIAMRTLFDRDVPPRTKSRRGPSSTLSWSKREHLSFPGYEEGEEVWAQVSGFPGYWVSDKGRVYSEANSGSGGTLMKAPKQTGGYPQVGMFRYGEQERCTVHRLVLQEHGPDPPSEAHDVVNHIDGDKTNNHVENLEWVTEQENRLHGAVREVAEDQSREHVFRLVTSWLDQINA